MSKDGQVLGKKEERWTKNFKQLLNPSNRIRTCPSPIFEAAKDLGMDLGPIRLNEVIDVVRNLKNGKTSGPDEILAEILKAHDGLAQVLWNIIDNSWKSEHLPEDWKFAQVVPLYKNKGKRTDCSNYCGISLLAAFDSVERDRLYEILRHCGLHVKIVNVIKSSYDGLNCRVKSNGVVGMPLTSELEFVEATFFHFLFACTVGLAYGPSASKALKQLAASFSARKDDNSAGII
ncbi:uncharacterized protein LOC142340644 [Convolutriloba macropyga]|uniref:uncharacterized protein LOC142340644 n=1 Tax=Convolutriloba macropyga TaxID=536237 RepID=UPI003F5232B8